MKILLSSLTAIFVATSAVAHAQSVLNVNFGSGYVNGDLEGQNGWTITGNGTANNMIVDNGLAVLTGGRTGDDLNKALDTPVNATPGEGILSSITFSVNSSTAGGDYFFHLSNSGGSFYQRLFVRTLDDGFQLGLSAFSTNSTITPSYGTTKLALNTFYTASILWTFVAGNNNDTFSLSVDQSPYLDYLWNASSAEPTALAAVNLRQGGSTTTPGVSVQSISVAAVPEPGTIALVGLGIGAVLLAARRRRA